MIEKDIYPPQPKSIAVLPFVNMSTSGENEFFSDGITEEIINALTRIPGLRVTSRTSSFFFKNKNLPIREIGQHLQVALLLEGSVRLGGDMMRITAQLIHADWGVAADILIFSIEIALTAMLYHLFKTVNGTYASIAAYARFAMVVIMGVNLLIYLAPLLILENPELAAAFDTEQLNGLITLFFDIHAKGILVWGIFFGIHLLILGLLVRRSARHPRLLGWLMQVGSLGYIIESLNDFCFSNHDTIGLISGILLGLVVIGELGFALWLMIKGIKPKM
jgi:TolB-like protein